MKTVLQELLSITFLIALSVLASVLVMIYGWGLQARSWWWIIGVGLFVQVFLRMLMDKLSRDKK